jgi:hypothetical protein
MLRRRLSEVFIADIKFIAGMPLLFVAILSPVIIIALHFLASSYISALKDAEKAMQYYTVIAVSLISAIPFIYGLVFSFMRSYGTRPGRNERSVQAAGGSRDNYFVDLCLCHYLTGNFSY